MRLCTEVSQWRFRATAVSQWMCWQACSFWCNVDVRHWVLEDLGSHEDFRGGSWVRRPVAPRAEPVGMPIRCFQCDGTRCSIFEMATMGFCVVEVHRGDSVPRRISLLRF